MLYFIPPLFYYRNTKHRNKFYGTLTLNRYSGKTIAACADGKNNWTKTGPTLEIPFQRKLHWQIIPLGAQSENALFETVPLRYVGILLWFCSNTNHALMNIVLKLERQQFYFRIDAW